MQSRWLVTRERLTIARDPSARHEPTLNCAVEERGDVTIVRVSGEPDIDNIDALEGALDRAIARRQPILVTLNGLQYIDSMGLHVLVRAKERAKGAGVTLVLAYPTGPVRRVMELVGLGRVVRIVPDPVSTPEPTHGPQED